MEDIIKIVEDYFRITKKGISETIKNEAKEERGGFPVCY